MRQRSFVFWTLATALLSITVVEPLALSQTATSGAVRGTVTDAGGGVMPNVAVEAVSSATGVRRSALTDGSGTYTLSLLPPGVYELKFAAKGFKSEVPPPVTVTVTEISTVNISMAVGQQEQVVEVSATTEPLVQSESAALGTVVEGQTIQEVPLTERNYTQVLTMSTGVNGDVNNAASLGKGTQDVYVNGTNQISNNFHMDGIDINNFGSGRAGDFVQQGGIPIPNPDTIQEFKIQTTLYDAGYGRDAGANVDVITKSGTNVLHGNLFEFLRNDDLDANDPFLKSQAQPRPENRQNQFGGTLGGRVIRNKLFYFGSYQGTRQINGISPTSFSSNTLPALTNDRSAATLGQEFCHQPTEFGGTQVACNGSNINPVALSILNIKLANGTYLIPTPEQIRTLSNGSLIGFSSYSIPARFSENQYLTNADYIISDKNHLEEKMFHSSDPQYQPFSSCSAGCTPGSGVTTNFTNDVASLKLTSVPRPNFVNEAMVAFIRSTGVLISDSKIPDSSIGLQPGNPNYAIIPDITVNGLFSIGGGGNDNSFSTVTTYQGVDQISFTHGRHSLRAGFEFETNYFNFNDPNQLRGSLTFQTFPDFLLGESAAQNGSPYSNVFSSGSAEGSYYKAYRGTDMDTFVQDDFKVNSRLTLNLGLRWELNGGVSEAHGDQSSVFPNLVLANPAPASGTFAGFVVPSNYQGSLPDGVTRLSGKTLASDGLPLHNLGPRFGFAWLPFQHYDKFVLRGGYGVFYTRPNGNSILQSLAAQPFVSHVSLSGTSDAAATFQVPYTTTLTPGVWVPRTATSQLSATFVAPNIDSPLTQQYNIDIQQEVLPKTVLEAAYVGTRSSRLPELREINQPLLASPDDPVNGITTNTVSNAYLRVPYTGFAATGLTAIETYGASDYNSLQLSVKHQLSHGIQLEVAYTWSKVMTDIVGQYGINGVYAGGSGNSNDPNSPVQKWGPASFDRANRVVIVYRWNIPGLGAGPNFLRESFRDWIFSGVTTIQTGTPLTITDARGGSIYGFASTSRAEICPGFTYSQILTPGPVSSRTNDYFNSSVFCAEPAIGNGTDYGDTGIGIVRGPGQDNFDMAIARRFPLKFREGSALEFRGEFFNALNHVQYSNPGVALGTASFGVIGSASVAARIVQVGAKFNF